MRNKINLLIILCIFAAMVAGQWNLDRINQRYLPLDGDVSFNGTGQGVRVYVVDSGIRLDHPELEGRAADGYGRSSNDCDGHGTGVAGIIGSQTYGVAKKVSLVSVKVRCAGYISVPEIIKGIDWAKRDCQKFQRSGGRCVVNMSMGSGKNLKFNAAVQSLIDIGAVVVAAAGNETDNACNYSPSSVPDVLTVGGTNKDSEAIYYSNYGPCVDLYAPGQDVPTIWNNPDTAEVIYVAGTSFAAPHVAGVAAIYLEQHPFATVEEVNQAITANATYNILTGQPVPNVFLFSNF